MQVNGGTPFLVQLTDDSVTVPSGEIWKGTLKAHTADINHWAINGNSVDESNDNNHFKVHEYDLVLSGGDTLDVSVGTYGSKVDVVQFDGFKVQDVVDNTPVLEQFQNGSVQVPSGETWVGTVIYNSDDVNEVNVNGNSFEESNDDYPGMRQHHLVLGSGDTLGGDSNNDTYITFTGFSV